MQRFVIVDPSLKDGRGHHVNLAKRVTQSILANGFKPVWFCHRDGVFDNVTDAKVVPVFGVSLYDAYQNEPNGNRLVPGFKRVFECFTSLTAGQKHRTANTDQSTKRHEIMARDLMRAVTNMNLKSDDRLLFHTADGMTYAAFSLIFSRLSPEDFPLVHICTPYDPLGVMPNRIEELPIRDCIQDWAERGLIGRRVFLYGETKLLAAHLSDQWKVPALPLELPALTPPELVRSAEDGLEPSSLKIVHLGPARMEKGFHLLPDIVKRTLEFLDAEGASDTHVSFIIQCSAQITGYSKPILKAIERLKSYPQCVTLLEDTLDDARYMSRLATADVFLLPYSAQEYGKRSSGIVAEALSFGKIIVATRDSYPASVIKEGAGATAATPLEFGQKLAAFAMDAKNCREVARLQGAEYRKNNRLEDYMLKCLAAENGIR